MTHPEDADLTELLDVCSREILKAQANAARSGSDTAAEARWRRYGRAVSRALMDRQCIRTFIATTQRSR